MIVPSKLLEKAQYAAHTIRPRLQAVLNKYLVGFGNPAAHVIWKKPARLASLNPNAVITAGWEIVRSVQPVSLWRGGSGEALRLMRDFVQHKLNGYATQRTEPEVDATSRLSPYWHFGHISPITVALAVQNANAPKADKEAFLNQIITWRELAVNLVRFHPEYDNFESAESRGLTVRWPNMRKIIGPPSTPSGSSRMPRPTTNSGTPRKCRW